MHSNIGPDFISDQGTESCQFFPDRKHNRNYDREGACIYLIENAADLHKL
jgi:hypothetical protein